jgi:membrane-associated phospholipid phosphatase
VSRLYAAEHWPSDVAGGIALGITAAALCQYVLLYVLAQAADPREAVQ